MTNKNRWKQETLAIHAGHDADPTTKAHAVPIYQTTAYTFDSTQHAADLFSLNSSGNIYTRIMNPTNDVFEKRMAALEGGTGALAVSSGQTASFFAIANTLECGDELVTSSCLYGGTVSLLFNTLKKFGIKVIAVDGDDPEAFAKAVTPKTKALFAETLGNPKFNTPDIQSLSRIAHDAGIPLIIDNTLATPYLVQPIAHGADIVVHSATKYINGHGNSVEGVVIDSGKFNWDNGKFPGMVNPDESYHGVSHMKAFGNLPGIGNIAWIMKCRLQLLRDLGAAASPFNSFLCLIGLESLHLRMQRHSENAMAAAEFLESHPKVNWVSYPGLPSHPQYELAKKYFSRGLFGGMIGMGIKGGLTAGVKVIESVKLFSHVANLGDTRSLIVHPASTTHQQLSEAEQKAAGITPDFVRLSIGLEHIDDIITDLEQALSQV